MDVELRLTRQENIDYYNADIVMLDLEEYLKGVVPSEIGNAPIEACAAQAICCRNYTISKIKSKGYITDSSSIDQAYRANRTTGYPNAYAAIEKTRGEILYYNGTLARCYYSDSNGGQTTSSKERWGTEFPYLISQEDTYDIGAKTGHGVGMSQRGAKERAKTGQTYQQILAFYFPGCNIHKEAEKMTKEQFILNWCQERIGCPYIYGGSQKKCTTSYRKTQAKQYPNSADNIYKNCYILSGKGSSCSNCKWWDKTNKTSRYAYDCAQFVRWGASAAGITGVKSGATSQWKSDIWQEKGDFSNVPTDKLCCVFRDKNGTKEHVGWYYNGYAYHAQGHSSGVVKTDNKQYKSWTHYAIMKGLYSNDGVPIEMDSEIEQTTNEVKKVLYQAKVASKTDKLNMRKTPEKSGVRILQIPPQGIVDVVEETNETWCQVIYSGKNGYVMSQYLTKDLTANTSQDYYVKIKCESEEDAKRIAKLLQSAVAE